MPIVENKPNNDTARYMKLQEKQELKLIIDELDELHSNSEVRYSSGNIRHPNLILNGYREIVEKSSDVKKTSELYHKIHQILKDHFVNVRLYRDLGGAFAELGIENIDPELKIAIDYGTSNFEARTMGWYGPNIHSTMRPKSVVGLEMKKRNSKER